MPSPVGSALLAFGAVLTSVSPTAGAIVASGGVLWEGLIFWKSGV